VPPRTLRQMPIGRILWVGFCCLVGVSGCVRDQSSLATSPRTEPGTVMTSVPRAGSTIANGDDIIVTTEGIGDSKFGAPKDAVVRELSSRLGTGVEGTPRTCDQSASNLIDTQWGPLTLYFVDGRFARWDVDAAGGQAATGFQTGRGSRIGMTLEEFGKPYGGGLGPPVASQVMVQDGAGTLKVGTSGEPPVVDSLSAVDPHGIKCSFD
jgi:hypothetical protein